MNCIKCNISCFKLMLHRTEPKGQPNAGWMCIVCIERYEPELARNIKGDEDFKVVKDIENICLNNKAF